MRVVARRVSSFATLSQQHLKQKELNESGRIYTNLAHLFFSLPNSYCRHIIIKLF